jgi:hypothetical protein
VGRKMCELAFSVAISCYNMVGILETIFDTPRAFLLGSRFETPETTLLFF